MKNTYRVSPILTLAIFMATPLAPVFAQDVVDEEVTDEDVVSDDEEIVDEDVITDEEVVGEDEEIVGGDEEVVGDDDVVTDEEVVGDEDVVTDEEVVGGDEEVVAGQEVAEENAGGAAVEDGLWEPGEEPYRPPPAGKGVLWGRLVDTDQKEPVLEGSVKVQGRSEEAFVDFDGYYRLELPPGTYTLELFVPLHEQETLGNVVVSIGAVNRVDAELKPQEGAVQTDVIEDEAETQTVEGLALARQRSVSQGDAIGREEIAKTADSNAAQAAQRVVGANIVGGRFVYVRGLGERYTNSLLGGYPLPSPEPDRAAVPLDVFPTAVIDSLTIEKTFVPDMPGDFAGGSVQLETRSVPAKPVFQVSVQGGLNTQSTFQDRLDYDGSSTDFLGFDSGKRSLPSSVPSDYQVTAGATKPDGSTISQEELNQIGRDVNSNASPYLKGTPPDHKFAVVGGNTYNIGKTKLGILASVNYSRSFQVYEGARLATFRATDTGVGYEDVNSYTYDQGVDSINWGAFGKVSFVPHQDHKITATVFRSQLADDITTSYNGFDRETEQTYQAGQLDWVERGLTFGMLSGRHMFPSLNKADLGWDVALSGAYRNEPDRVDTVYSQNDRIPNPENPRERLEGWTYLQRTESGRHFWAEQTERSNGGKVDWRQPILEGDVDFALKAGGLINIKRRDFSARRFQMDPEVPGSNFAGDPVYNCVGDYTFNCPDQLLNDDNVGQYIQVKEGSQEGDAYKATLDVYAGYLMADVDLHKKLRIAGGARVEHTSQTIDPRTPYGEPSSLPPADLNKTNLLPAVSLVYSATKKFKTRLSYTQTLARPQMRELAPFAFSDYFGGNLVVGNPNLTLTTIRNVDSRIEYWPSLTDVLAFTVFYKNMSNPIETYQLPTGGGIQTLGFQNSERADVIGAEFEVRKNLRFLTPALAPFSVITNLTVTASQVTLDPELDTNVTNSSRTLMNQAPWVFNFALNYENEVGTNARLIYNVNAPTLVRVGTFGLPDAYALPVHSLDFAISQDFWERWNLRAQATNLINPDITIVQGKQREDNDGDGDDDNIVREFKEGTVFSLRLTYAL